MARVTDCVLCGTAFEEILQVPNRDMFEIRCRTCGRYRASGLVVGTPGARGEAERKLLAGVTRNATLRGQLLEITTDSIPGLLEAADPPATPFEAADRLLMYVRDHTTSLSSSVPLTAHLDFPLLYSTSEEDFRHHVSNLLQLGYVEATSDPKGLRLTLDGWRRIEELGRTRARSDQAFVAMWFDVRLLPAWTHGFSRALEETGYVPRRIDLLQHNERIDDKIMAEIKRSGLLVADFTGHRGGVYFEAGYAMGLGIPVIWTCRSDDLESAHFDTRQYNHIAWTEPEELRAALVNRILATVGEASLR